MCIHEKTIPRQLWRLGEVQRLLPGPDGEVRSAVVKVKSGNLPSSEWRHPLLRLYPLEVKLNTEPDNAVPITVACERRRCPSSCCIFVISLFFMRFF